MKGLPLILAVITAVVIVAVIGMPLGGFVFGIAHAQGPGSPGLVILVGIAYAILTSITLGFPPKDESGNHDTYNAWPYILGTDLVLLIIVLLALWIISARGNRTKF
jgi:hypothetical protein